MLTKPQRQAMLAALIRENRVSSQHEIVQLLREKGVEITQASVSRDIRELSILKINGFYRPSDTISGVTAIDKPNSGKEPLNELVIGIEPVGANLIVIRTPAGVASALAVGIDERRSPEVAGTIAGDDTVFVAVRSRSAQGLVVAWLKNGFLPGGNQPA